MALPRFGVLMSSAGLMLMDARGVCGQDYPNKPIRIVTAGVSGGVDFVSRMIAQGISGPLEFEYPGSAES